MTYMLDTNICIYAMKNKPEQVLQRLKKELESGDLTVFVESGGVTQKFLFTRL